MFNSYYNSFDPNNLSWTQDEQKPDIILIKYNNIVVMKISLCEAMESAGRKVVMNHVRECDNSPWLKKWHEDKMDQEISILKGES